MKLYSSVGPNPRMVRMFMAQKEFETEIVKIDTRRGDNRKGPYAELNPAGTLPALELDDGTIIAEITAICEYVDEVAKGMRSLIGSSAEERAHTRMWVRRIDLGICEPATNGFRFAEGLDFFRDRVRCIPQAAADLKATARDNLRWLDGQMGTKPFLTGDKLMMEDIHLFAFLDFIAKVGQPLDPDHVSLGPWFDRMKKLPSAAV